MHGVNTTNPDMRKPDEMELDIRQPVVVLGAGLMGRLCAWRLARQGFETIVIERSLENNPEAAAYTAAAMVAPISERPLCHDDVFQHGLRSLKLWPLLLEELQEDSNIQVHFNQKGSLIVAHPSDEAEMKQFESELSFHGLRHHAHAHASINIEALNTQQIRELEPDLAHHFEGGFWLKDEAQVDNRMLLPALQKAAIAKGAHYYFSCDVSYHSPDNVWQVRQKSIEASNMSDTELAQLLNHNDTQVLDCRGLGAHLKSSSLRGVRGEVMWVESKDVQLNRPVRLLHPRYHLYLVPRGENKLQLGATEIESADRTPVSVRSAMEMMSALWCLSPSLAEARILSMETNLRPATLDHCPVIERYNNKVAVSGLFRHGYLMAPSLIASLQQNYACPMGLSL